MFSSAAKEILLPFPLDIDLGTGIKLTVPKKSGKTPPCGTVREKRTPGPSGPYEQGAHNGPQAHTNRLMQMMKTDLHLPVEPRHIECFDNSNIQGTNPVSSCVVFKNGKPSKKGLPAFHRQNGGRP